ncbi:MAG: hypothetical protein JRJ01_16185, partial [Deltaproteobacteria bacterium]|nr:hypothetical protein [Deltaproteobacteria bacterium]
AGISADGWGLRYSADAEGKVIGFFVGEKRADRRAEARQSGREVGDQEKTTETQAGGRKNESSTGGKSERIGAVEPEVKPEPETGPYSGASSAGEIAPFASLQQGRFGETSTEMPPVFARLKKLDKAELVLRISYLQRSGYASGRIFINTSRALEGGGGGGWWYGAKRSGYEEFLGDFSIGSGGEELRFDITSWLLENPADKYFVVVENLARGGRIEVKDVRIEFSGVR